MEVVICDASAHISVNNIYGFEKKIVTDVKVKKIRNANRH